MAQTDTRPGFRLPWSPDHDAPADQAETATSDEGPPTEEATAADEPTPAEEATSAQEHETPDMIETTATATTSARRPTKFMAELSRAMQAAVETSRDETMARLGAEAKTVAEEINAKSAVEAAELRRRADDDVAAVREWSKTEIARIREETEARIALRKTALDGEMDQHAAVVETRVQQVGATISAFEGEMAAYFERLCTEEDPTRIAAMAEQMPEPPDLAGIAAAITVPGVETVEPEPAAETEAEAEVSVDADPEPETVEEPSAEPVAEVAPDFAAAEAEAAAFTGDVEDEPQTETETETSQDAPAEYDHRATAAQLAATDDNRPPQATERSTTRVSVGGLVSVASIATFKRSLGRVPGVSTIGVASGPDGEFVFTVSHDAGIALGDAIAALPGFEARVMSDTPGALQVVAHDPDAGS